MKELRRHHFGIASFQSTFHHGRELFHRFGVLRITGEVRVFVRVVFLVVKLDAILAFTPLDVAPALGAEGASHHVFWLGGHEDLG